jgi:hypothetical protein
VQQLITQLNQTQDFAMEDTIVYRNVDTGLHTIVMRSSTQEYDRTYLTEDAVDNITSDYEFTSLVFAADGDGRLVLVLQEQLEPTAEVEEEEWNHL